MTTKAANGEGPIRKKVDEKTGSVYWWTQFTLLDANGRAILNESGNPKRPLIKGKTQKEVQEKRDKLKREAAAGKGMRKKNLTACQVVEEWMRATGMNKEGSTNDAYLRAYRNHIVKHFNFRADLCTGDKVNDILRSKVIPAVRATPGATTGRSIAKRVYDMVNAAMKWASAGGREMVTPNPMTGSSFAGYGKVAKRNDIGLEDARAIIEAAQGRESELIWRLLLATGARRGEILGLDVRHVNLRKRELLIEQISTPESGGKYVEQRTKGKEPRIVPFDQDCATLLAQHIADKRAHAPLFKGPRSPRLSFATLRVWFDRDQQKAGVSNYTVHQFRHTFATHALVIGTPVNVVAAILGHASVNITWNTYGHVLMGSKGAAVDDVASAYGLPVANSAANGSTTQPWIPATARDSDEEPA